MYNISENEMQSKQKYIIISNILIKNTSKAGKIPH